MKYRVIDAPGHGDSRSNKVKIHSRHRTAAGALKKAAEYKGFLAQEAVSSDFGPKQYDWMDWAHRGGIAAGYIRNL